MSLIGRTGRHLDSVARFAAIVILSVASALSVVAQSQGSVKGVVIDRATGKPIRGVNIILVGTTRGTATDDSGKFWIRIPAGTKQVLEVSIVGYTKEAYDTQVREGQELNVEIKLDVQPVQVGGVSVVGRKPIEEAMASYVIGEKEIRQTPGLQFLEVLQRYAPSVLLMPSPLSVQQRQANFTLYVNEIHWEAERYNEIDPLLVKKVYVWKRAFVPIQFKLDYGTSYVVHVLTKP